MDTFFHTFGAAGHIWTDQGVFPTVRKRERGGEGEGRVSRAECCLGGLGGPVWWPAKGREGWER